MVLKDYGLQESKKRSCGLTNGYNEGHAEKLAPKSPLDLVEEVVVSGPKVSQDESEFCQGLVEGLVIALYDLVPVLPTVLPGGGSQEQVCQVGGRAQELGRVEVDDGAIGDFGACAVFIVSVTF